MLNTRCRKHTVKGLGDMLSQDCTLVQGVGHSISKQECFRRGSAIIHPKLPAIPALYFAPYSFVNARSHVGDITNEESIRSALPGVNSVIVCVGARRARVNGATVHSKPQDIEGPGMANGKKNYRPRPGEELPPLDARPPSPSPPSPLPTPPITTATATM